MKKTQIALYAVLALAALTLFCFDATAASHLLVAAAAAAVTVDDIELLPELAKKFKEKTDEVGQRMTDLEQAVVKGLKGASESSFSPVQIDIKSITENPAFEALRDSKQGQPSRFLLGEHGLKALFNDVGEPDSANGTLPSRPDQIGGWHGYVLRPLRLLDVLPSAPAYSNSFDFVRLSFAGDAQVQDGEGAEKAEVDFEGSLETGKIATIAAHTTTSAQVLDDNSTLQAEINRILSHKLRSTIETQLITGSGTGVNLEGIYTAASAVATPQAQLADRIGYAITQMETEGYNVNMILMNPLDWFAISILKDADGNYIYGNPASPARPSLWNRPIISSPTLPEGTALIGDTSKAMVRDRMQPTVFLSRDHKDYRTRNLVLILVEARLGLAIFDDGGFRKVSLEPQSD